MSDTPRPRGSSAREEILQGLRLALEHPADYSEGHGSHGLPLPQVQPVRDREALVVDFATELTRIGAHCHRVPDEDAAGAKVAELANPHGAYAGYERSDELAGLELDKRLPAARGYGHMPGASGSSVVRAESLVSELARLTLGITRGDAAVAETGSVVLLSSSRLERLLSLLPQTYVAVVRAETVVARPDDMFARFGESFRREGRPMASSVTFVTGPSRTGDIEATLVVGVHGPKTVHVVMIG